MTDFEWLDSGPNCSEGHYSMHSKNPHLSPSLYTTDNYPIGAKQNVKHDGKLHVEIFAADRIERTIQLPNVQVFF